MRRPGASGTRPPGTAGPESGGERPGGVSVERFVDHPTLQTSPPGRIAPVRTALLALTLMTAPVGCGLGSAPEPPGPGWERGGVPELRGAGVLLLPVQGQVGVPGDIDSELAHALREAGPSVRWIGGRELAGAAEGAGPLGGDPGNLPVSIFERGEVERVGDPLFGTLYRLAAVTDATYAVLPVTARGEGSGDDGRGSVSLNVALLETRTGRVLWQGILQGSEGSLGTPAATVSAAERLARRLLP